MVNFIELGLRAGGRSKKVKVASHSGPLSGQRLKDLGDKRKKVAAKPWLAPALKSERENVERRFVDEPRKEVEITLFKKTSIWQTKNRLR